MKKTSGPDRNDQLMKRAGFFRCPELDSPKFNVCGEITYWVNEKGLRIITSKNRQMSLKELVNRVTNQAAYRTRTQLKDKIAAVEFGEKGFIS